MSKASTTTVWVLTTEHNDYNQYGAYFLAVFAKKPEIAALAEALKNEVPPNIPTMEAIALIEHIRAGGGRRGTEDKWFNLEEVELR